MTFQKGTGGSSDDTRRSYEKKFEFPTVRLNTSRTRCTNVRGIYIQDPTKQNPKQAAQFYRGHPSSLPTFGSKVKGLGAYFWIS
jgi:hypothetical protein